MEKITVFREYVLSFFPEYRALEQQVGELKQEIHRLSILVERDRLTGILNAEGFENRVQPLLNSLTGSFKKKRKRTPSDISIAYCDLDHLKNVNDKHGHDAGDFLIRCFVKGVADRIRDDDDIFARWYRGDEFVLALVDMPYKEACEKMEAIQHGILKTIEWNEEDIPLSFSYGITSVQEMRMKTDLPELLKRAEDKMYIMKGSR